LEPGASLFWVVSRRSSIARCSVPNKAIHLKLPQVAGTVDLPEDGVIREPSQPCCDAQEQQYLD
jgi:hypothetical protein